MNESELRPRDICPICNFERDHDPFHAPSCSEAPWNQATPPPAVEEAKEEHTSRHQRRRVPSFDTGGE